MDNKPTRNVIDLRTKAIPVAPVVNLTDILLVDADTWMVVVEEDGFRFLQAEDESTVYRCAMKGCGGIALAKGELCAVHRSSPSATPEPPPNETTTRGEPIPATEH